VLPFVGIQVLGLALLWLFPGIVTILPRLLRLTAEPDRVIEGGALRGPFFVPVAQARRIRSQRLPQGSRHCAHAAIGFIARVLQEPAARGNDPGRVSVEVGRVEEETHPVARLSTKRGLLRCLSWRAQGQGPCRRPGAPR
jgi:hypothetical protein